MWPVEEHGRPVRPREGWLGAGRGKEGERRLVGRLNRGSPQCLSALILHSVRSHGQTNRPRRNKGGGGRGEGGGGVLKHRLRPEETSRSGSHNALLQTLPLALRVSCIPCSPSFLRLPSLPPFLPL